jgi:hypothetical protein
MNGKQLVVLRVGVFVILLLALFPPWRVGSYTNAGTDRVVACDFRAGYAFLFNPPESVEHQARVGDARIDLPLLLAEWAAAAGVTWLVASFLRNARGPGTNSGAGVP